MSEAEGGCGGVHGVVGCVDVLQLLGGVQVVVVPRGVVTVGRVEVVGEFLYTVGQQFREVSRAAS